MPAPDNAPHAARRAPGRADTHPSWCVRPQRGPAGDPEPPPPPPATRREGAKGLSSWSRRARPGTRPRGSSRHSSSPSVRPFARPPAGRAAPPRTSARGAARHGAGARGGGRGPGRRGPGGRRELPLNSDPGLRRTPRGSTPPPPPVVSSSSAVPTLKVWETTGSLVVMAIVTMVTVRASVVPSCNSAGLRDGGVRSSRSLAWWGVRGVWGLRQERRNCKAGLATP